MKYLLCLLLLPVCPTLLPAQGRTYVQLDAGAGNQPPIYAPLEKQEKLLHSEAGPAWSCRVLIAPLGGRLSVGMEASWANASYQSVQPVPLPSGKTGQSVIESGLYSRKLMLAGRYNWLYQKQFQGYAIGSMGVEVGQHPWKVTGTIDGNVSDVIETTMPVLPAAARLAVGLQWLPVPFLGCYAEVGYGGPGSAILTAGISGIIAPKPRIVRPDTAKTHKGKWILEAGIGNQMPGSRYLGGRGLFENADFQALPKPAGTIRLLYSPANQHIVSIGAEVARGTGGMKQTTSSDPLLNLVFPYFFPQSSTTTEVTYSATKVLATLRITWLHLSWIDGYVTMGGGLQTGTVSGAQKTTKNSQLTTTAIDTPLAPIAIRVATGVMVKPIPAIGFYGEAGLAGLGGQIFSVGCQWVLHE